jgi:serine/threonine protein kinase
MLEQEIGNYKIHRKLGAGSQASVYLATHKDVPSLQVVLKVLSDPRMAERFRQEADKLAQLDAHGQVCHIRDFFFHGDEMVIAMDFIDGYSIDELLKKQKKLSIEQSLTIVDQILETLDFAHEKKIFHRDIKPSNIMLDRLGKVKIIDFGIAKSDTDPDLTWAGGFCGTVRYMAPEQFDSGEDVNLAQVDIYAVGTTLYYMLTGEFPLVGNSIADIQLVKQRNEPVSARTYNTDIPQALDEVILKAIARDPGGRYHSVAEFRKALQGFRRVSIPEETKETTVPSPTPIPPINRRRKTFTIARITAAALVAVAVIITILIWPEPDPRELAPPALIRPMDGEVIYSEEEVTFKWGAVATERDQYQLQYSKYSDFSEAESVNQITKNNYNLESELSSSTYFWRVRIQGPDNNYGPFSLPRSFQVRERRPLPGSVYISISPEGDLYIDGNLEGRGIRTLRRELDPGNHEFRAVNDGCSPSVKRERLELAPGEDRHIEFNFLCPESPRHEQQSTSDLIQPQRVFEVAIVINFNGIPQFGGQVFIDSELQEESPPMTYYVAEGDHKFEVKIVVDSEPKILIHSVKITSNLKLFFDPGTSKVDSTIMPQSD